jgi:hypothetical protein
MPRFYSGDEISGRQVQPKAIRTAARKTEGVTPRFEGRTRGQGQSFALLRRWSHRGAHLRSRIVPRSSADESAPRFRM